MLFVSFASTHALRARRRTICAPPELKISAHGNALKHNNFYYTRALLNLFTQNLTVPLLKSICQNFYREP